jgi:ABC-type multidrug transport system fused ATPase/permease subunit
MSEILPIAGGAELREQARALGRRHRRGLLAVMVLHALAAGTGLAGPPLLGELVQSVVDGTTRSHVDRIVLILAGFLLFQTVFTWFARRASFVLAEQMFAELREDFMRRVLALPLSTVEKAGTGDLVSRTTADVDSLARTIRFALPETLIASVTTVLTVVAAVWVNPLAAIPCIAGVPILWAGTRWYLRRAPAGYLWERASYATLAGTVGETVDGGRTIEALGLGEERVRRIDADLEEAYRAEARTLFLRTVWFPTAEFAYVLPVAASLASLPTGRRPTTGPRGTTSAPRRCATRTSATATSSTGSTSSSSRGSASPWWARPARASRRSGGCSPGSTRRGPAGWRSAASGSSTCRSSRSGRRSRS